MQKYLMSSSAVVPGGMFSTRNVKGEVGTVDSIAGLRLYIDVIASPSFRVAPLMSFMGLSLIDIYIVT